LPISEISAIQASEAQGELMGAAGTASLRRT
jgi:hypothetical protein